MLSILFRPPLADLLRSQWKYDHHFELHDKSRKELGVVECLRGAMQLRQENGFHSPQSCKYVPPDLLATARMMDIGTYHWNRSK